MTSLKKSLFLLVPNDKSLECLEAPSSVISHEPSVSSVSQSFSLTVSRFCSAVVLKNVDNVLCELSNLKTRMKRAWSNERRHRSFSLVYVSPKWNFYKLKSFSQNSLYFTSFVQSGRITGPVSIFIMGHFVALCAIRAWRTAFLIPAMSMLLPNIDVEV